MSLVGESDGLLKDPDHKTIAPVGAIIDINLTTSIAQRVKESRNAAIAGDISEAQGLGRASLNMGPTLGLSGQTKHTSRNSGSDNHIHTKNRTLSRLISLNLTPSTPAPAIVGAQNRPPTLIIVVVSRPPSNKDVPDYSANSSVLINADPKLHKSKISTSPETWGS